MIMLLKMVDINRLVLTLTIMGDDKIRELEWSSVYCTRRATNSNVVEIVL